jgi:hypothetical protein
VTAKFPAAMTPTLFAEAARSISAKSSSFKPEEPMTTWTPLPTAASTLAFTASAFV